LARRHRPQRGLGALGVALSGPLILRSKMPSGADVCSASNGARGPTSCGVGDTRVVAHRHAGRLQ
jgi:hypothetical protein